MHPSTPSPAERRGPCAPQTPRLHEVALWLAAFLYDLEPADEVLAALSRSSRGRMRHRFNNSSPLVDLLGYLHATGAQDTDQALRLVLGGPGDPVRLGPSAPGAALAARCGGALVIGEDTEQGYSILVPELSARPGEVHWWALRPEHGDDPATDYALADRLPAPDFLSPGEADYALARATEGAAELIEAAGYHAPPAIDPRLTVGELGDHLDSPGKPSAIPDRAAKLLSRADRVADLLGRVIAAAADHRFDAELLALLAPIRRARVAAVDYAVREWGCAG